MSFHFQATKKKMKKMVFVVIDNHVGKVLHVNEEEVFQHMHSINSIGRRIKKKKMFDFRTTLYHPHISFSNF